jgi:hypothetical protein
MPRQSIKKLNLQKELDALLLALRTAVTNAVDGRRAMEHLASALEAATKPTWTRCAAAQRSVDGFQTGLASAASKAPRPASAIARTDRG